MGRESVKYASIYYPPKFKTWDIKGVSLQEYFEIN